MPPVHTVYYIDISDEDGEIRAWVVNQ